MMDPQARQDCLKEVRILQNLEHPNIVKCFNSYIQARERASRTGSHWRAVRESHHQRGGRAQSDHFTAQL